MTFQVPLLYHRPYPEVISPRPGKLTREGLPFAQKQCSCHGAEDPCEGYLQKFGTMNGPKYAQNDDLPEIHNRSGQANAPDTERRLL